MRQNGILYSSVVALRNFFNNNLSKSKAVEKYFIKYLHPDIKYIDILREIIEAVSSAIRRHSKRIIVDVETFVNLGYLEYGENEFKFRFLKILENIRVFMPEVQRQIFGEEIEDSGLKLDEFIAKIHAGDNLFELYPILSLLVSGLYAYHSREVLTNRIILDEDNLRRGIQEILSGIREYREKLRKSKKKELIQIYDNVSEIVTSLLHSLENKKARAYSPKGGIIYVDLSNLFIKNEDKKVKKLKEDLEPQSIYAVIAAPLYSSLFIQPMFILAVWLKSGLLYSTTPILGYTKLKELYDVFLLNFEYISRFASEVSWKMEHKEIPCVRVNGDSFSCIRALAQGGPGYQIRGSSRIDSILEELKKLTLIK